MKKPNPKWIYILAFLTFCAAYWFLISADRYLKGKEPEYEITDTIITPRFNPYQEDTIIIKKKK